MARRKPNYATYATPYGKFRLQCYPPFPRDTRQPWNAADTLLLEAHARLAFPPGDTLVVNDTHGALGTALAPAALWTDSALSVSALRANESANERSTTPVYWCDHPPPSANVAVLRVPRHLSLLVYQLTLLAQTMPPGAALLAAGMDKHLSPHTAETIEKFFGPTERHRGRHKARLFTAEPGVTATAHAPLHRYLCEEAGGELIAFPGVFSGERLDAGSRLLLEQLERLEPVERMIDLGCGNGVLGLVACRRELAQSVTFADESALALASTRRNAAALLPGSSGKFDFLHGDGLSGYRGPPVSLILCNPPFHQEASVEESAGRHLLTQCKRHLRPGGQLCVVANRHLRYRSLLTRQFERVEKLAENRKFVVWRCLKSQVRVAL